MRARTPPRAIRDDRRRSLPRRVELERVTEVQRDAFRLVQIRLRCRFEDDRFSAPDRTSRSGAKGTLRWLRVVGHLIHVGSLPAVGDRVVLPPAPCLVALRASGRGHLWCRRDHHCLGIVCEFLQCVDLFLSDQARLLFA